MGTMGRKQGEQISFSLTAAAVANVALIGIYDANGVARTLQPYERLIVDVLSFDTEATDVTNQAYIVAGVIAPTPPVSGAVPASPVVAAFTVAQGIPDQGIVFPAEGFSVPLANNLYLVVPGTGLAGTVTVAGTGRVINGKTQGVHPNWQAPLTPGGNANGQ